MTPRVAPSLPTVDDGPISVSMMAIPVSTIARSRCPRCVDPGVRDDLKSAVTLFRSLELVYRPMLSVPLGRERSPVFGGERELATRPAILPFELLLRYRMRALSW
jgi:hypothetical protein